jgi:hypothetical protein
MIDIFLVHFLDYVNYLMSYACGTEWRGKRISGGCKIAFALPFGFNHVRNLPQSNRKLKFKSKVAHYR